MSLKRYSAVVWKDGRRLETAIEAEDFFSARDLLAAQFPGCNIEQPVEIHVKDDAPTSKEPSSSKTGCLGVIIPIMLIGIYALSQLPGGRGARTQNRSAAEPVEVAESPAAASSTQNKSNAAYSITRNKHGLMLKSAAQTLYLGKDCDASSTTYGAGSWAWNSTSIVVTFGSHVESIPSDQDPLQSGACESF